MQLNNRPLHLYTVALLATLALAGPAAAQGTPARARNALHDTSRIRIENFGRVDDNYFRGGQPQGHDYADLAGAGVKTVINLTSDDAQRDERSMTESAGMKYFQIPMTTHQVPTAAQITEFLRIVNDPANQPVYVHCVGGRHRTGVMTAVYRMSNQGWSASQAFAEMKTYKFGADFLHSEFKDFVLAYPAQLAHAVTAVAADAPMKAKAGG